MFGWARNLFGINDGSTATAKSLSPSRQMDIVARYDNAQTQPENVRQWLNTDYYSARAANNYQVRRQLRTRSRHEVANNPFLFGIVNGNSDDVINTGPTLQCLTSNVAFNKEVEAAWNEWAAEVEFTEKLRTTKLARTVDGEGFLIFKTVEDLENPVKLYPVDIEADQVTTPQPHNIQEMWVDGVDLHPITQRPRKYSVLKNHPGDMFWLNPLDFSWVNAQYIVHWYPKFRPGQVRGIPIFTSSLDLFNDMRGFRNSVMKNAQLVAQHTILLSQELGLADTTEDDNTEYEPFKRVAVNNGMQTVLPPGMKPNTLDPKQPATTYEMFQTVCIGEACRPLSYPLNLALGTSHRFNFSSAKLDHINYRHSINVERSDCERAVLNKSFKAWYTEAVLSGAVRAWNGLKLPPIAWYWPGFEPLDPVADANADLLRLNGGMDLWRHFWSRRGYDWKDVAKWQGEEKDLHEKFKLQFGDPVHRTEYEDTTAGDPDFEDRGNDKSKPKAARPSTIRAAFNESDHPRADNGEFTDGSGSSASSVDKSKPHYRGDKDDPHQVMVQPGEGKDGADKLIHRGDPRFGGEMSRHAAQSISEHLNEKLNDMDSLVSETLDDESLSDEQRYEKVSEAASSIEESAHEKIDKWAEVFEKHLDESAVGGDQKLFTNSKAELDKKVERTKKDISRNIDHALSEFANGEDYETISDTITDAINQAEESLNELAEAFTEHTETSHEILKDRTEQQQATADESATELNDDYADNSEEANERAADLNEWLAETGNDYRVHWEQDQEEWVYDHEEDAGDYPGKTKSAKASRKVVRHAP